MIRKTHTARLHPIAPSVDIHLNTIRRSSLLGRAAPCLVFTLLAVPALSCGQGSTSGASVSGYKIVMGDGSPLVAMAGDAVRLIAVQTMSDGTTASLPSAAKVVWSGPATVQALAGGSMPTDSALPPPAVSSTAFWLTNPEHYSEADLAGVLWVLDQGSGTPSGLLVTATISGVGPAATATATLPVSPMPAGDVARGAALYGANCSACHGVSGHGTSTFPGLNNEAGHVAGDPEWSAALLAMTARSDMDNMGVSLDPSMPKWLTRISANGKTLATQDFADIYAFLKTQNN
jgi:mono/diheme cytochrome c family protein